METVIAEWGGRRYSAKVDGYGGALIIGGPIEEVESEKEQTKMADQNEQEQFVVDVKHFVQTLVDRQDAFEAKINARIAKTDELQQLCVDQQIALRESLETLKELIAGKTDWTRPDTGSAAAN